MELKDVKGDITFENVSFQYEENTEKVLNHISLNVPAGAYMALVGSSGAGKSTLCSLIPRFYDVTGGAVKIDGKDVRDLTLKSLRDHIGIVQQDVYLFVGTVFDNIRYGKPDATREEVIEAAKTPMRMSLSCRFQTVMRRTSDSAGSSFPADRSSDCPLQGFSLKSTDPYF